MRGVRFYLEYPDVVSKRNATRHNLGNHIGNVIAVFPDLRFDGNFEAIGALYNESNSVVCSTVVGMKYLWQQCLFISEKMARDIHPNLFEYLDACDS